MFLRFRGFNKTLDFLCTHQLKTFIRILIEMSILFSVYPRFMLKLHKTFNRILIEMPIFYLVIKY